MPTKGLLKRFDTKICCQSIGYSLGQDLASRPVHDGNEVRKAFSHRNIGDVGCPDLIGAIDRVNTHLAHETKHPVTAHADTTSAQLISDAS